MTAVFEQVAGVLGLRLRPERPTSPFEMIQRIQDGFPLSALERISVDVAPNDANFKYLIVPRATFGRRKKLTRLTSDESDRVVRLAQVWVLAREVWGGDDEARAFLFRPHMMLEGKRPIDVAMATDMGARLVEDILGRLKYGSAA
ncbi:MAG: hypothetical protein JWL84_2893 [Rhodospirillales bacterium]|nr:hypothetical protein [Rhodospirillales bacterium]